MRWGDFFIDAEVLVALAVLLPLVFLVITWVRRRRISHGRPLVLCAARSAPGDPWRDHLLRLGTNRMTLHPLGGLSTRPRAVFDRRDVELGHASPAGEPVPDLLRRRTCVCATITSSRAKAVEMCLAQGDYMALRSWTESAPPVPGDPRVV